MRAVLVVVMAGCAAQPVAPQATTTRSTSPATAAARSTQPVSTLAQLDASHDLDGRVIGASDAPATVVMVMASWCRACREELAMFDRLREQYPRVRWLAVNYEQHEEYDQRGNAQSIRALAHELPWLRIVPADDALYTAVGRPAKIPTVLVFHGDELVARFDRSQRPAPTQPELAALLR
jgi:thiol-disulfide isomerase/thioredoxin